MAMIYNKETDMTDLQRRVTAELKQRERQSSSNEASSSDGNSDDGGSNRMERLPGWVWLIALAAVVVVGLFIAISK